MAVNSNTSRNKCFILRKYEVERREFLPSGEAEEPRISAICKATTTKPGGKKAGDILWIFAG
jgi:hypothetical protein